MSHFLANSEQNLLGLWKIVSQHKTSCSSVLVVSLHNLFQFISTENLYITGPFNWRNRYIGNGHRMGNVRAHETTLSNQEGNTRAR